MTLAPCPQTLVEPILQKIAERPDEACFYTETDDGWKPHTHREFHTDIIRAARALLAHGIAKGDRIGVLGPPSYEWEVADKAIMYLGAITVGLDGKSTAADLEHMITMVGLRGLFVESAAALQRIPEAVRHSLEFVYLFNKENESEDSGLPTLRDALEQHAEGEALLPRVEPEDIGAIIFTSGTTGRPKGIPLKQRQLAAGFAMMDEIFRGERGHRTLAWTPFYNITGRMMECNNYYMNVAQYFIKDPQTLIDQAKRLHPTYLVVLPRILEKVYQGVQANLAARPPLVRAYLRSLLWARRVLPIAPVKALTDALLVRKVRDAIWGNSIQFLISGSAPVDPMILKFFDAMGVPTLEVYGMSECGFLLTMNRPGRSRYGSVGEPLGNMQIKLADDGEVLAKTGVSLEHYWQDPDTSSLYDDGGYLKTGDLGELRNGYLYLTGRKKEIIKTSTGLRVPPITVESVYKVIPGVDNVVVVGNNRKFVSALVSLDDAFRESLAGRNVDPNEYLVQQFEQRHAMLPGNFQCRKFALLPRPLSVEEGEITPTLKLRRMAIEEKYKSTIDALYE